MKNILLMLLAIMPILNIYCLPFGPDIPLANVIIITLATCGVISRRMRFGKLPRFFVIYWVYIGVAYFILTLNNFKVVNLIPGGLSFFVWVIILSVYLDAFDLNVFRKYYRVVFTICGVVLLLQEFLFFTTGQRFSLLFPLPLSGGMSSQFLKDTQLLLTRSSSFFREPSHFAQFALPLLAIELFNPRNKNSFISGYSVFILICLIVLRSGNGFLGMITLIISRFFFYFKESGIKAKLATLLFVVPLLLFSTVKYTSTESGQEIVERFSNVGIDEDSESFDRIFRGYLLYQILPNENKVFGISHENLESFIGHSAIAYLFMSNTADGQNDTYLNGIQHILVHFGAVGLILFFYVLICLYVQSDYIAKTLIITFLIIMFVGNVYASHMMLLTFLISYNKNKYLNIAPNEGIIRT